MARLTRQTGLRGRAWRRFVLTTDPTHRHPVAPNTLERNCHPSQHHRARVGDITYVWTDEGWLYLAVLLNLFSRRVVGEREAGSVVNLSTEPEQAHTAD
ncbi:hypothetical protein [Corallococcus sp. Z5C101001]|uniref:hypothetical protein n=1 Tax=Corallococcus sp. Z5C101001 TaxID=2596829 RepID=UPI0011808570|nr:hypothetical protein [Corallococcus sp. Z5C101001]TSC27379.1 hypothetical protein FOF48_18215 [Corallococcus sp. Z5C101001]